MDEFLIPLLVSSLMGNLVMLKIIFEDIKHRKKMEIRLHMSEAEIWRLKGRKYRRVVRFLDPHGMPQTRLDEEIESYQEQGWTFDEKYSVNGLLAFYREEEIKDGYTD